MTRVNKNLIVFTTLILTLGVSTLLVIQRLIPLTSQTLYYCQSFISSLSLPIPSYLSSIPLFLFSIFLTVTIGKLFFIYINVRQYRKKLLLNRTDNKKFSFLLKKLHLGDKTYFIESEKKFAFCLGIRNPQIYISMSLVRMLSEKELEAVLRHEKYHLNKRDTFTMLVASTGASLLPFFPLFSDLLHNYRVEREIEADAAATQGLGDATPLISALKKLLAVPSVALATSSAIADEDTLEPRICVLTNSTVHQKRFKIKHIIVSVFSIFALSITLLAPIEAFAVSHQGGDVVMVCPHGGECAASCREEYSTPARNFSENKLYSPAF